MTSDELKKLESRFYQYTKEFTAEASDPGPYLLKEVHTKRVCDNIDRLSDSLGLGLKEKNTARATALLHDIGRFPQFKTYGTFSDPLSKNHAALGVRVVVKKGFTGHLPQAQHRLILRAVALHNHPALPSTLPSGLLQLARMLRDADKIDIFKVMTDLYNAPQNDRQGFITHNLPDDKKIPDDLVEAIISGRRINYNRVNTLNGLKLFQLSMILDMNFPAAFEALKKQGTVRKIIDSMPVSSRLEPLEVALSDYIENKISS